MQGSMRQPFKLLSTLQPEWSGNTIVQIIAMANSVFFSIFWFLNTAPCKRLICMYLWTQCVHFILVFPTTQVSKAGQGTPQGCICPLGTAVWAGQLLRSQRDEPTASPDAWSLFHAFPPDPFFGKQLQEIPVPRRCLHTSIQCNKLWGTHLQWLPKKQASYSTQAICHGYVMSTPHMASCHKRSTVLPWACAPCPPQLFGATLSGHRKKHSLPGQQSRTLTTQGRAACLPQARPPSSYPQSSPIIITPIHSAQRHPFNPFYITSFPKDTTMVSSHPKCTGASHQTLFSACGLCRQRWATAPAVSEDDRDGEHVKGMCLCLNVPLGQLRETWVRGTFTEPVCAVSSPGRMCIQKYGQLGCE